MEPARGAVQQALDWWMPVLYMRLKTGRMAWYKPGFYVSNEGEWESWDTLLDSLNMKECTPILGLGMLESLIGPRAEIASELASRFHYPLAPHNRESLPQVLQYIGIEKSMSYARNRLLEVLKERLKRRFADALPIQPDDLTLGQMFSHVAKQPQGYELAKHYRDLAQLRLPLYVTTDPSDLLRDAFPKRYGRILTLQPCSSWVFNSMTRTSACSSTA